MQKYVKIFIQSQMEIRTSKCEPRGKTNTVELRFSNLIHSGRLFRKRFAWKVNLLCMSPERHVTDHTGISTKGFGAENQSFFLQPRQFSPWTTWWRTELFEMGDVQEPRFDCKRKQIPSWCRSQLTVTRTRTSVRANTCPTCPHMPPKGSGMNLQPFQSAQFVASVFCGRGVVGTNTE